MADDTDQAVQLPAVQVTAKRPDFVPMPVIGNPDDAIKALTDRYNSSEAAVAALGREYAPKLAAANDAYDKTIADAKTTMANTPEYKDSPGAPDLKTKQISGAAVIGAVIAGLLAGRAAHISPFMTAAETVTKTFNAFNANDAARREAALQDFKAKIEEIDRYNKGARDRYNDAMELAKTNVTLAQAQMEQIHKLYFDGIAQKRGEFKSFQETAKEVDDLLKMKETARDRLATAQEAMADHNLRQQEFDLKKRQFEASLDPNSAKNQLLELRIQKTQEQIDNNINTRPQAEMRAMFQLDDNHKTNAADAKELAGAAVTVRFMNQIEESLGKNPDLNRKVSQLAAKASGHLDNWFRLMESDEDAQVQAFAKNLLPLRAAGAAILSGPRGITATGDRIADRIMNEGAASPKGVAEIARTFALDNKAKYSVFSDGTPIPWDKVQPLPLFGEDRSPLIGPGASNYAFKSENTNSGTPNITFDDTPAK